MSVEYFISRALELWPGLFGKAVLRGLEASKFSAMCPPEDAVDFGCGDGNFSKLLGWNPRYGVELDPMRCAAASATGCHKEVLQGHESRIPLPDASTNFIFANSVLEHVPQLDQILSEMKRALRPGGTIAFTAPSPQKVKGLLFARPEFYDKLGVSPHKAEEYVNYFNATWGHLWYLSEEQWTEKLVRSGLKPVAISGYENMRMCAIIDALHYVRFEIDSWDRTDMPAKLLQSVVIEELARLSVDDGFGWGGLFIEAVG